ncbi:Zn(II)2Cys6 transcription factor domain-containing protein [Aspergillus nidulans FGSC A4]|uniref:Zn(II)2Cys6 transcription factor (Eurofung) n=1 Tax=Emericella nidulans (strain FGSC A4 / ATCC 38163 / CBS 112.46 / NRRL 194 / M139) TaxID=227321 RepID=C8VI55_EMENI|nr:hypothetical protein [Aspergillus nidulans FGSC A4]CBF83099.1 TPA: Putative Zn(II)2Cys6 transcription factor (Eurofung) [Aspergillus nidulans FGSC A4]
MQRKACDQCYSRKKKCLMDACSSVCVRCEKLSLACTVLRRVRRPGRPPGHGLPGVANRLLGVWERSSTEGNSCLISVDHERGKPPTACDAPEAKLSAPDSYRLPPELQDSDFYLLSDIYMFGPTFARDLHRALEYCHRHSPHLLAEIFRALGSCLSWARLGELPEDQVDVKSGAVSIEKLRNAEIKNLHDAVAVLMLGQALAAFDSLVTSTGAMSILRCSLSLICPWYPDIAEIQLLETIAIAPVFWDTVWCLLHREVPVLQPLVTWTRVVDRVAGLCTSLLPILYNLCVFGQRWKDGVPQPQCMLDSIEQQIRTWSPDDSALTLQRYSTIEILSIRTQASMYRTAALLLVHWIRHPLASPDPTSTSLANDIISAREEFFASAGPSAKLQNTSFPLSLALLEVPISPDRFWESSTWLRTRPACVRHLSAFTGYVWDQRYAGFESSLFDLVKSGPNFVPVP